MKVPTPEDIQAVAEDPTLFFCWFSWTQQTIQTERDWKTRKDPTAAVYRSPEGEEYIVSYASRVSTNVPEWPDMEYLGIGRWDHLVAIGKDLIFGLE